MTRTTTQQNNSNSNTSQSDIMVVLSIVKILRVKTILKKRNGGIARNYSQSKMFWQQHVTQKLSSIVVNQSLGCCCCVVLLMLLLYYNNFIFFADTCSLHGACCLVVCLLLRVLIVQCIFMSVVITWQLGQACNKLIQLCLYPQGQYWAGGALHPNNLPPIWPRMTYAAVKCHITVMQ